MLVLLKYDVQLKIFSVGDGPKSKKLLTPNNISIFAFSARVAVSSSLRMKNRHIAWALIKTFLKKDRPQLKKILKDKLNIC